MSLQTLSYSTEGRIARITLNRPERLNAIVPAMPREIRIAVDRANADDDIHVIILQGAGRAFCSGYDLKDFAEADVDTPCTQSMPWDPMVDYRTMKGFTDDFFSLWRSHKPTEGQWFKRYAEEQGYKEAVRLRDSGEPIPGSKSYKDY